MSKSKFTRGSGDERTQHYFVDGDGDQLLFGPAQGEGLYIGAKKVGGNYSGVYVPMDQVPELFGELLKAAMDAAEGKDWVEE